MKDVTQIKQRLIENIRDYQNKKDIKEVKSLHDDDNISIKTFNAAEYLFVSNILAKQYPDLKESKIISYFNTPWPRQS